APADHRQVALNVVCGVGNPIHHYVEALRAQGLARLVRRVHIGVDYPHAGHVHLTLAAIEPKDIMAFGHRQPADRSADKTGAPDEKNFHCDSLLMNSLKSTKSMSYCRNWVARPDKGRAARPNSDRDLHRFNAPAGAFPSRPGTAAGSYPGCMDV